MVDIIFNSENRIHEGTTRRKVEPHKGLGPVRVSLQPCTARYLPDGLPHTQVTQDVLTPTKNGVVG